MGTSSARKAPVGKFWRTAKTSTSRFASGKEASPPQVGEVVARYVTALEESRGLEGSGGREAILPDVVRTAARLEKFYGDWEQHGWKTALERLGLIQAENRTSEEVIPALLDRLAGPGARLDEAVARAALIDHFGSGWFAAENFTIDGGKLGLDRPDSLASVGTFLGLALFRKFLSDLGEPLEFQAATIKRGIERQEEVKLYFLEQIKALGTAGKAGASFAVGKAAERLELIISYLGGRHGR